MTKKKWDSDNIPDQKDRVAIVTGSSSGIGYETARVLADKKATVIIAVRNLQKGASASGKIKAEHSHADIHVMEIDLASLASVRSFAEEFKVRFKRLDLLINNAGVMMPPYSKTADGFELQFGTNHLGHFALAGLLIDLLITTNNSRIVNVSSSAHHYGDLNFDDLDWESRSYNKVRTYGDSKIANLYFTYELGRKIRKKNLQIITAASHPGWTATELQRHTRIFSFLNRFVAQDISMGALPTLYAAVGPDVRSCDYFGPSGWRGMRGYPKKVESNKRSHDEAIAHKLWEVSEALTGVKFLSD